MNNRVILSGLIEQYDEADNMVRITSGETLSYWENKRSDAGVVILSGCLWLYAAIMHHIVTKP